jgi:hypothetical protein
MTKDADQPTGRDRRGEDGPPPTPRWVKYLAVVLAALIAVAVLMMLIVGGEHGPARHGGSGATPAPDGRTVAMAPR